MSPANSLLQRSWAIRFQHKQGIGKVLEQLLELGEIMCFQGKTKNPVTIEITEF